MLFEQHWASVNLYPKQHVWLFSQVLPFVELSLTMKLVGGEVQIPVRCQGHCVRPKHPRIVNDRPPLAVSLPLTDAIVFVVPSVDTSFVITFKTIRRAFFAQINHRAGDGSVIVGTVPEK